MHRAGELAAGPALVGPRERARGRRSASARGRPSGWRRDRGSGRGVSGRRRAGSRSRPPSVAVPADGLRRRPPAVLAADHRRPSLAAPTAGPAPARGAHTSKRPRVVTLTSAPAARRGSDEQGCHPSDGRPTAVAVARPGRASSVSPQPPGREAERAAGSTTVTTPPRSNASTCSAARPGAPPARRR